jgi:uncharacterized protein YkwD
MVIDSVTNPSSRTGLQNAKAGLAILVSLAFAKPAAAGTFTCGGTGISHALLARTPTPHVPNTATPTPTVSSTATATPTQTPAPSATPTVAPSPTATDTPNTSGIPTSGTTTNGCLITPGQAVGEAHLLALLNADRAVAGVAPLTLLPALSVASRDHSCDMGAHNTLSHTGSDGSDPTQRISATGTTFSTAGENVGFAGGYGIVGGIDVIDHEMMREPLTFGTHHWNIVNAAFHQVGIGAIYQYGKIWITEDFVG